MRNFTRLLPAALLLATTLPAMATSPWHFGTIVRSDAGADGRASLSVLLHLDNYKKARELHTHTFALPKGLPVYLDGSPSTAAEAFKPGRTFTYFTNHNKMKGPDGQPLAQPPEGTRRHAAIFVSTAGGPALPVAPDAKDATLLVVRLGGAIDPAVLVKDVKQASPDATLLLELRDGKIAGGVAWTPDLCGAAWHEIDPAGLTRSGGQLSGEVKVTFRAADGSTPAGRYTLTTSSKGHAFTGSFGDKQVQGRAQVEAVRSTAVGKQARLTLWTQHPSLGERYYSYMTCLLEGPEARSGYLCFRKSEAVGTLRDASITRREGGIEGSFTAAGSHGQVPVRFTARVLDGWLVLAELTVGADKQTYRASGFLVDAKASPLLLPGSEASAGAAAGAAD